MRVRTGMPSPADVELFKTLIVIEWPFDSSENNGFPAAGTLETMEAFETTAMEASDEAT